MCSHCNEPDFVNVKSALQELVGSHGHIFIFHLMFYFDPEFIVQHWVQN